MTTRVSEMIKYKDGAFAFFRNSSAATTTPERAKELAAKHGVADSVVPEYQGDRTAATRALARAAQQLARSSRLLRPVIKSSSTLVYRVVEESCDRDTEELYHINADTVRWGAESPSSITGPEFINTLYQEYKDCITATDWTATITRYLLDEVSAVPFREDGRVYWLPPQAVARASQLRDYLREVGITLVLCEIEGEAIPAVREAAQESLADKLATLRVEAQNFDGGEKPSTYTRRLEEYRDLKARAAMYRAALGVGVETVNEVLTTLEQKVQSLLDIRTTVVRHHDGSVSARG